MAVVRAVLRVTSALLLLAVLASAVVVPRKVPTPPTQPQGVALPKRALTVLPRNEHAILGGNVTLVCEVSVPPPFSRVHWYEFVTLPGGNPQMISDNGDVLPSHPNQARYELIMPTSTTFNLLIKNVQAGDAGTYLCIDASSSPENGNGQADLTVLWSAEPNCDTTVPVNGVVLEGQQFTKSCLIRFSGNIVPFMSWTGPDPYDSVYIPGDDLVTSGVLFTVDRRMDTGAFRCTTNFTELSGLPSNIASNAPDYSHVFQYGQLFVYWPPKNLYILPVKPEYAVGDVLSCYADAFPIPFYAWLNMRTNEVFQTPTFTVGENMIGFNTTVRCQAQNIIQGFLYSQDFFQSVIVPMQTIPTTTPTTLPTTTPPLNADCTDLSGWWRSIYPYAEILIEVQPENTGKVIGWMKNDTAQQWVEVVGRTRLNDFAYVGVTTIWPYEAGVSGMSGECHRCSGEEVIIASGIRRSYYANPDCGAGSLPTDTIEYTFFKYASFTSKGQALLTYKSLTEAEKKN